MHNARAGQWADAGRWEVVGTGPRSWPAVERRDMTRRRGLVDRIRGEFVEMLGLAVTPCEAARLLGVPLPVCSRILQTLIEDGHLRRTQDGRYIRPETTP